MIFPVNFSNICVETVSLSTMSWSRIRSLDSFFSSIDHVHLSKSKYVPSNTPCLEARKALPSMLGANLTPICWHNSEYLSVHCSRTDRQETPMASSSCLQMKSLERLAKWIESSTMMLIDWSKRLALLLQPNVRQRSTKILPPKEKHCSIWSLVHTGICLYASIKRKK